MLLLPISPVLMIQRSPSFLPQVLARINWHAPTPTAQHRCYISVPLRCWGSAVKDQLNRNPQQELKILLSRKEKKKKEKGKKKKKEKEKKISIKPL